MRRDNRRRENEGAKTLMYVAGSVVLLIIISVIIGIMVFGNKEDNVTESQFSTSKISDLVPNVISNQITEEASSEFGRTVNEVEKIANNTDKDYFIAAYLGTRDARYDQVNNQMVEMLKRDTFKNTFVYYQAKDAYHDMNATDIDMYNGLQLFFK